LNKILISFLVNLVKQKKQTFSLSEKKNVEFMQLCSIQTTNHFSILSLFLLAQV